MEIQPVAYCTQAPSETLEETAAGRLEIHTDWSDPWDGSPPDAERHRQFAAYALEVAMQERPLLIPFLARVGATVTTRPHGFAYRFSGSQCWIDVPEITSRLVLLPWVEVHETMQ